MPVALIAAAAMAAANGDLDARIAEAAAAEQALRGPLEGAWILRDGKGRALYALQIADAPDGPLGGAWRDLSAGDLGVIAGGSRGGGHVHLKLALDGAERAWLSLRCVAHGQWRGRVIVRGRASPVTLTRN